MTKAKAELVLSDQDKVDALRAQIEKLSTYHPMWSRSAYTHRHTTHIAFSNGAQKAEGEASAPPGSVDEMIAATMSAVQAYRDTFPGPVNLVWRCEPELREDDRKFHVYTRLCFEPVLEPALPFAQP